VNYFLYIVTSDSPENNLSVNMNGVGKTSLLPGINDAPFGVLYVVPGSYILTKAQQDHILPKHICADWLKRKILRYWDN